LGLLQKLFGGEPPAGAGETAVPEAGTALSQAAAGPAAAGRHVLVVEDDDSLRDLVSRNLAARGHHVRQAATADQAFEALRDERPDVIVLDINLPDATGWDILRGTELDDSTSVVMLTAVPVSPKRLAEFRPVAYLPKPFPLEALLRLVERSGQPEPYDADQP
jgi:DNA-binding response OmpR family regulator